MMEEQKIKICAEIESIAQVSDEIENYLAENQLGMKVITKMLIAIDEIMNNIVNYAYSDVKGDIEVVYGINEGVITIKFIDYGVPYNPLEAEDPDTTLAVEDRKIGGLGIFIVKKSMDNVEYEYNHKRNILTLYKKI